MQVGLVAVRGRGTPQQAKGTPCEGVQDVLIVIDGAPVGLVPVSRIDNAGFDGAAHQAGH
eukprot:scaffold2501_cov113-Isochrysis_galbana.AAC.9